MTSKPLKINKCTDKKLYESSAFIFPFVTTSIINTQTLSATPPAGVLQEGQKRKRLSTRSNLDFGNISILSPTSQNPEFSNIIMASTAQLFHQSMEKASYNHSWSANNCKHVRKNYTSFRHSQKRACINFLHATVQKFLCFKQPYLYISKINYVPLLNREITYTKTKTHKSKKNGFKMVIKLHCFELVQLHPIYNTAWSQDYTASGIKGTRLSIV